MDSVWNKIVALKPDYTLLPLNDVYERKMNTTYFNICYFNLFEKWLCDGISEEDWIKIEELRCTL